GVEGAVIIGTISFVGYPQYLEDTVSGQGVDSSMSITYLSVKEVTSQMALKLDDTYSAEVPYNNSLGGTGDIVMGSTGRNLARWSEDNIIDQKNLLDNLGISTGGRTIIDIDHDGLPDTLIGNTTGGGQITEDANSINLDIDGDGDADIIFLK
ncbi:MAG: hypothetical protein DRQ40_10780, partial [Gammaproteobacteria bacterium]